jgi:hypothetical protein
MADKPIRKQIRGLVPALLEYAIVAAYFYLWSYKTEIRTALKVGSLGLLSVSAVLLYVEIIIERFGAEGVSSFLATFEHPTGNVLLIASGSALVFLLWHHFDEGRKPGYEYVFVQRLCDVLEGHSHKRGELSNTLEKIHSVFERSGVSHVSVYLANGDALVIAKDHVYPPEADDSYYVPLRRGEGVAGLVMEDGRARYVPRLYFPFRSQARWIPNLFFPHSVSFEFRRRDEKPQRLELGQERLDFTRSPRLLVWSGNPRKSFRPYRSPHSFANTSP